MNPTSYSVYGNRIPGDLSAYQWEKIIIIISYAYRTPSPNIHHRLAPDIDYNLCLICYTLFSSQLLGEMHRSYGSTSYSTVIPYPTEHAPRYTPPLPYDHRICNKRQPSAFWYLPHKRYLCARSGKSSTSCSHMGETHPFTCSLDVLLHHHNPT